MSNLKLIKTETFGDLSCNFYRNMNDDILLTREQIEQALEYADPIKAIQKIYLKKGLFSYSPEFLCFFILKYIKWNTIHNIPKTTIAGTP